MRDNGDWEVKHSKLPPTAYSLVNPYPSTWKLQ